MSLSVQTTGALIALVAIFPVIAWLRRLAWEDLTRAVMAAPEDRRPPWWTRIESPEPERFDVRRILGPALFGFRYRPVHAVAAWSGAGAEAPTAVRVRVLRYRIVYWGTLLLGCGILVAMMAYMDGWIDA